MKRWILVVLSSVFFINYAQGASSLPDELGDFKLGMPIQAVENILNSKGLQEVSYDYRIWAGDERFPESSYSLSSSPRDIRMCVHLSTASPYNYDGENWEWLIFGFYQGELYDIQLLTYYAGQKGKEECYNSYKNEDNQLQSLYKNFEKEANKDEDYENRTYEYENKQLFLLYSVEEDLSSMVLLVLRDSGIEDKVFGK